VVGLVAALSAGCGGSHGEQKRATPVASARAFAHPHIIKPADAATIPATAELGETRGAKIAVAGTAEPETKLAVTTGCQLKGCGKTVTTDSTGGFTTSVTASTSGVLHRVAVIVSYEISATVDSDQVIVTIGPMQEVSVPRSPRRARHRARAATPPTITAVPPTAIPVPETTPVPRNQGGGSTGSAEVIGDSLAQGMQPYMAGALPGWKVSVDARIGRPLAEGMRIFSNTPVHPGSVYAFSLFTNDDPRSLSALDAAVRQSVQRGNCAVWSTIVRPPVGGVSYGKANQLLRQLAASSDGRVQLVDWAAAVAAHPDWVPGADGVHASGEGYRNRAALYAKAIQSCGG
jgi:hypothetical protein